MVFERGTAANTFQVMDRLTDFMTRVPGWQMWANIDGYSHRDFVYRSIGSNEKNDIYIRQRIGAPEPFIQGADQYDYGEGDTGYLNFFSYVYFPQNGDAYSGASEVGSFGPRLVHWDGNSGTFRWWTQDVLSQQPGGSSHMYYGTMTGEEATSQSQIDYQCRERRRWTQVNNGPNYSNSTGGTIKTFAPDGKRYIYLSENPGYLWKYSMARGCGGFDTEGNVTRGTLLYDSSSYAPGGYLCYYEDRTTRTPYLFVMGDRYDESKKLNLLNNSLSNIANPTWPSRDGNSVSQGGRAAVWDGDNHIYVIRGGGPDWGIYNIADNSWINTTIPESAHFQGINEDLGTDGIQAGGGASSPTQLIFAHKDVTGFDFHMLIITYYTGGLLHRIKLNPESGMPIPGERWEQYGRKVSNNSVYESPEIIMLNRQGRMYGSLQAQGASVQGIWERFPQHPSRGMVYGDLYEDSHNFRLIDEAFFPSWRSGYTLNVFFDGYACRTRTTIGGETEYIFIGDEDRIIVATKSGQTIGAAPSEWSVAYMGAFNSNYDSTPYAELAEDVRAGPSRVLRLKNKEGSFLENSRYFIIGTNGPVQEKTYIPDKRIRKLAPAESIKITKAGDDFIIASIKQSYKAGAKIAIDPQPAGVFFWELEKFQATNAATRLYDDVHGADSPIKQIYSLPVDETTVKSSITIGLNFLPVYDMVLTSGVEGEGNYTAREVRGKMKGVYAIGINNSVLQSEDTIALQDGDAYIILELPDYINKHLIIGPINE